MTTPNGLPVNHFKQALRERRQQIGLWHSLASPLVAEVTAGPGADWVLLDGEHSPLSIESMPGLLRAVEGCGAAAVVRPVWNDDGGGARRSPPGPSDRSCGRSLPDRPDGARLILSAPNKEPRS